MWKLSASKTELPRTFRCICAAKIFAPLRLARLTEAKPDRVLPGRAIAPWMSGAAQTRISFAQQPLNILCLVEVLGGVESDRLNQPHRGEVCPIEIGAIKRDAGERRAAQGGAAQRGIGEIRILERCEFEV